MGHFLIFFVFFFVYKYWASRYRKKKEKEESSHRPATGIFVRKDRHTVCWIPKVNTVYNGLESIRYRGPKVWESLPTNIKESKSLAEFKIKIKTWKDSNRTCRLCKTFIANIGFID